MRVNSRSMITGAATTILLLSFAVAASAADIVQGERKAAACAACHGNAGVSSDSSIPSLAAQPALSVYYQLVQFKDQRRTAPGMNEIAASLGDSDMKNIAAYFASLPPPAPQAGLDAQNAQKAALGRQAAEANHCNSCHMPQLTGQKHIPRLAGQHAEYLKKQLQGFRTGARQDMDGTMASAAQGLSDKDIENIALYAASLKTDK